MSGIYIPGMEMPKNCHLCPYSYLGRDYSRVFCGIDDHYIADLQQWDKPYFWGHKEDSCPIIPVPDHHDLIDKNDLKLALVNIKYEDNASKDLAAVFREVNLAKTIIPAEEVASDD